MNKKLLSTILIFLLLGMFTCIIFEGIYCIQHPTGMEVKKCEEVMTTVKQTKNNKTLKSYYGKKILMNNKIEKLSQELKNIEFVINTCNGINHDYLVGQRDGFRKALEILAGE